MILSSGEVELVTRNSLIVILATEEKGDFFFPSFSSVF